MWIVQQWTTCTLFSKTCHILFLVKLCQNILATVKFVRNGFPTTEWLTWNTDNGCSNTDILDAVSCRWRCLYWSNYRGGYVCLLWFCCSLDFFKSRDEWWTSRSSVVMRICLSIVEHFTPLYHISFVPYCFTIHFLQFMVNFCKFKLLSIQKLNNISHLTVSRILYRTVRFEKSHNAQ